MGLNLRASLGLNTNPFEKALKGTEKRVAATFKKLAVVAGGLFALNRIRSFQREMTKWAGNIRDLANQMNAPVEMVQRLDAAARQAGQNFDLIRIAAKRLSREVANPKAAAAFGKLGLNQREFVGINELAQFDKFARAMKDTELSGDKLSASMKLIGEESAGRLRAVFAKGVDANIPLLNSETIDNLDRMGGVLKRFTDILRASAGILVSVAFGEKADQLDKINDQLLKLFPTFEAWGQRIGDFVMDLTDFTLALGDLFQERGAGSYMGSARDQLVDLSVSAGEAWANKVDEKMSDFVKKWANIFGDTIENIEKDIKGKATALPGKATKGSFTALNAILNPMGFFRGLQAKLTNDSPIAKAARAAGVGSVIAGDKAPKVAKKVVDIVSKRGSDKDRLVDLFRARQSQRTGTKGIQWPIDPRKRAEAGGGRTAALAAWDSAMAGAAAGEAASSKSGFGIQSDSLRQIGGFRGAGPQAMPAIEIARSQLRVLQEISKKLGSSTVVAPDKTTRIGR
jgi:hypothetical protein